MCAPDAFQRRADGKSTRMYYYSTQSLGAFGNLFHIAWRDLLIAAPRAVCAEINRRAIIDSMRFAVFLKGYFIWHYSKAVRDFSAIAADLLWFGYHFFSMGILTKTLFSPFARIHTTGFSITEIELSLQNLTANIISRAVGFFLRVIVISAGVTTEIILGIALIAAFVIWLILPLIILFLLAFGMGIIA